MSSRAWFLAVAVLAPAASGACGRIDFDAVGAAPRPDGGVARACDWASGPPFTGAPDRLSELNSTTQETDPFLADDGLTLYFGTARDGTIDEYVAHRDATSARFAAPTVDGFISTDDGDEDALTFSPDGLEAYYTVIQPGRGSDMFVRTRASPTAAFGPARALSELNTDGDEFDPFVDSTGTLWFTGAGPRAGSPGGQDILTATRADRDSAWGNLAPFDGNTTQNDGGARLTDDGLLVVWAALVAPEDADIFYAERASIDAAFGPPQRLDVASSGVLDNEPFISRDGCSLYFTSVRDSGDINDWDLYALTAP